ncbi:proline/glycine betaine ABC transporter permease [Aeromicrobium phragmitis]|uniref:Proline/glycine betaine ABC transporter permease n=1 Tax=Aeromicrobium phragmitis TaxID=2478914 RepID=A0A3L8PNZ5_9ACTN|nr:proline/glycine betaine ABC transporter permease [Aeromicrobium phragmitis]RLV55722.1 proline/glycine betaine ABC transporter permease [Aeromicrobium phragmitis]
MSTLQAIETVDSGIPRIPVGDWVKTGFDWVKEHLEGFFDAVSSAIRAVTDGLTDLLQWPPALVLVVVLALLAWLVRDWKLALGSLLGLLFVVSVDQWDNAMATLSLVLVATIVALLIAVPLGILAARSDKVSRVVRPLMDLMQTMPAFVWLVPTVTLFSLGMPAALVATVIFALPPGVRLTELGIRQVDAEVVEAGQAFGGNPRQILGGIQLPLAMPTIMAGVNQVIMLALSMAVIAGFVGAGGLGNAVVTSISRLDVGLGFEAGLSVVALAIFLDRITAAVGSGSLGRLRRRVTRRDATPQSSPEAGDQQAGAAVTSGTRA